MLTCAQLITLLITSHAFHNNPTTGKAVTDNCGHVISVWVGDAGGVAEKDLSVSPEDTDNWKTVVTSTGHTATTIEHDDLDDNIVTQYVRFDFDLTNCPNPFGKTPGDYVRIYEIEILGEKYIPATTLGTSTTRTYTQDPSIGDLEEKLSDLQNLLEAGGSSTDELVSEIKLIKDALVAANTGPSKKKKGDQCIGP